MKDKIASKEATPDASEQPALPITHPSRSLKPRAKGYGIGGGYEKPYHKRTRSEDHKSDSYGPVPHSGYYGAGAGTERFERGQAGFNDELPWYGAQYGESTAGRSREPVKG